MRRITYSVALALVAVIASGNALGGDFTKNGYEFQWTLNTSFGTNVRTAGADRALISFGNGGKGGIGNDAGDLNFENVFSTTFNAIGDIHIRHGHYGAFLRAKAWTDLMQFKDVPHGNYANGFTPNTTLNTSQFDPLSKYSNAAVLDAYVYGNFSLGADKPLNVRVGKQVVNWGESLFIPGINQFGAFDATAAHRAGAQVKEILLPIPQVFVNLGLAKNFSIEGFYQFLWSKTVLDGCGTYWSPATIINCSKTETLVGPSLFSDRQLYQGVPALGGLNFRMSVRELKPSDQGQYGIAVRYRATSIDTDFGLYFAEYHPRTPNVSAMLVPTTVPGSIWGMTIPGSSRAVQAVLDYSAEHMKVTGISASTSVKGWTVMGEVSHSFDVPAQLNVPDLLNGVVAGIGPLGSLAATPDGRYLRGYERKQKTQAQVSTINAFSRKLGAENITILAEAAYQHWSDMGDPATGVRYGRAFVYGSGPVIAPGVCEVTPTLNTDPAYCENKGFATTNTAGYRLLAEFSYPNVFKGINIKPRLFWSHDVKGYSADAAFSENRMVLSPGLRFERSNKYYVDFAYSRYNHGAKYDEFHDRDYFSFVIGKQW